MSGSGEMAAPVAPTPGSQPKAAPLFAEWGAAGTVLAALVACADVA
jgi:hypothetical protein